jgi:hypothetical protein
MKRLLMGVAVLALFAAGAGRAPAGFMAVSSALTLQADANAGGFPVTDHHSQSQGATTNALSVSVDALSNPENSLVEATATGSATWTSAGQGSVVLSNVGWTTQNVGVGSAALANGLDYAYTFVSDQSGTLTLSYNVAATGTNTFGLNGFRMTFDGDVHTFNLNTSGTVSESVVAGTTYTLGLKNLADIGGGLGTRDAHMGGTFDFNFTPAAVPVPEPGSATLLGIDTVGLIGYAWRRTYAGRRDRGERG